MHIDLCYVQSTAARVRDHAVEMAAKRRRRLAKVRSSEEFFCTVRSLLASLDRTIFSLACGLLQPHSQAPPSFRRLQYVVSRSQTLAGGEPHSQAPPSFRRLQYVVSRSQTLLPARVWLRETMQYAFPYCKRRKAGRGLGTRLLLGVAN